MARDILPNADKLAGTDQAGTGTIDAIGINASDEVEIAQASTTTRVLGAVHGDDEARCLYIVLDGGNPRVTTETADASDTKSLAVCGGGNTGTTRGGSVIVYGNEHATRPGGVYLERGNASGSQIVLGGLVIDANGITIGANINRLLNAKPLYGRNAADSANILLLNVDASDNVLISQSTATTTQIRGGRIDLLADVTVQAGGEITFAEAVTNDAGVRSNGSGDLILRTHATGSTVDVEAGNPENVVAEFAGTTITLRSSTTDRIKVDGTGIGFFAATPVAKPTVTGSRGGNAALADLLTDLASLGLITDSTSA